LLIERQRSDFHAADAQEVVDKPRQPRRFRINRVQELLLLLDVDHVGQGEGFRVGFDVRQRRAQLVGGGVDELIAHLLGQLLLGDIAERPDMRFMLPTAGGADWVSRHAYIAAGTILLAS
jgi:hypothetical protein